MKAHNWTTQEQRDAASERLKKLNSDAEFQKKCREAWLANPENQEKLKRAQEEYRNDPERVKASAEKSAKTFKSNPENSRRASERIKNFRQDPEFEKYRNDRAKEANSKKVICLNTLIIYDSMTIAAKLNNTSQSKISEVCRGNRKSAGKNENEEPLRWQYYQEYLKQNGIVEEGDNND